ncbi:hypothetical protein SAMN05192575_114108 [Nocardioides alpinus]|uniref:Uncharacterized protein n=1 Tax=Nocardioides alpinus TaxID=748909 RepID=A0A1I1B7W8_9ACTN|nr:hypothetical protein SAMN05192575_114108 [Nocardioides alpinus]
MQEGTNFFRVRRTRPGLRATTDPAISALRSATQADGPCRGREGNVHFALGQQA